MSTIFDYNFTREEFRGIASSWKARLHDVTGEGAQLLLGHGASIVIPLDKSAIQPVWGER